MFYLYPIRYPLRVRARNAGSLNQHGRAISTGVDPTNSTRTSPCNQANGKSLLIHSQLLVIDSKLHVFHRG